MAGTLTISTLSDGTNSTSSTNCIQGSAKAWVNYKGTTTMGIRASYNVSSVTYTATAKYVIAFTNAMSDANYTIVATGDAVGSGNSGSALKIGTTTGGLGPSPTTASFQLVNIGSAYIDSEYVCAAVFR